MNSPKNILTKSSKKICVDAAEMAEQSEDFLNELIDLSLNDIKPYSHRASWAVLYLSQKYPNTIRPHLRLIASKLTEIENHTQIGSFLRVFDQVKFDHEEFGDLLDFCIHIIRMPVEREYLKVIAMSIILRFGKVYPELVPELIEQIELCQKNFEMNHCKRKAVMVLKELKK